MNQPFEIFSECPICWRTGACFCGIPRIKTVYVEDIVKQIDMGITIKELRQILTNPTPDKEEK